MAVTWKRPRHGIAIRWVVKSETQTYLLRSAGRKCSPSNAPPIEALNRCHPPTSLALIYPYPPHPHSIGATHQLEKHPKEWLSGRMKVRHRCGREDQPPHSIGATHQLEKHPKAHSIGATHQLEKHPKEWLSGRMKVRHRCGREDQHRGSKQPPFNRYHLRSRWMPNHPAAGSASSKSLGKRTIRLISCLI
jgi:hypothetical protein